MGVTIHDANGGITAQIVPTSNNEGALLVTSLDSGIGAEWDYIAVTYPSATSEVYTYKIGGAGGTTVATITVTYTDSSKGYISSISKA